MRLLATLLLLAIATPVTTAAAQRRVMTQNRAELEAQVRREFARTVQERVGLTEQQMAQLLPISERYAAERRELQRGEIDARIGIQRALRAGAAADSAAVSRWLQVLVDVQKRRATLMEQEQRELAAIMTPVQRARYMALQDQVRRRVDQRRGMVRPGGGGGPPRQRPPGP